MRLPLLMALILFVTACSNGDGESYLPATAGQYWQYDVLVTTMDLVKRHKNVVQSLPIREESGQKILPRVVNQRLTHEIIVDDQGYWFHSGLSDETEIVGVTENPAPREQATTDRQPILLLPLQPEVGMSWTGMSQTHVLEGVVDPFRRLVNISVPVKMTYTIEADDAVITVAAGDFSNCLRVRGMGVGRYDGDKTIRKMEINVEQTDWYAPGIGLVKRLRKENSDSTIISRGEYVEELEVYAY